MIKPKNNFKNIKIWVKLYFLTKLHFFTVNGNPMSKIPHEHFFDMQHFRKSEFGFVEKQYLQLNIKGCYMLCLMEKQTILLEGGVSKLYLRI